MDEIDILRTDRDELRAALVKAIELCKEATVSMAGRHIVDVAIFEMVAALEKSRRNPCQTK